MKSDNRLIRILALSWRDITSPNKGGAEVNTHEIFKKLDPELFVIEHFAPLYPNQPHEEVIDGVRYIRQGNVISVIFYAWRYYIKNRHDIDYVVDQCNTHRFFTPFWVKKSKRVFLIYQLTREIWDINMKPPVSILGKITETPMLRLNKKDQTITESESTKADLVEVGFDPDRVHVLPIIMQIKPWSKEQFKKKYNYVTFVYVGRYAFYKGIDAAIEAIGILKGSGVEARLIILGKRNEDYINDKLIPICKKYDLVYECAGAYTYKEAYSDRISDIIFAGFVSEQDKLDTLSSAQALVFPSDREGWGIPISEAAYVGTPSIVYNSQGIIDAIDYGRAGYLCKDKTAQALAECMRLVVEDDALYDEMRTKAYEFSRNYLEVDINAKFKQVIGLE